MINNVLEVWKPVVGYEGLYEVSNLGRIKSFYGRKAILKTRLTHLGYVCVRIYKNKIGRTVMVHRLVAEAFLNNPNNLPEINHKDYNRTNNYVCIKPDGTIDYANTNLEWCDRHYNVNYSKQNVIGKKIIQIYWKDQLYKEVLGLKNASKETGLCVDTISKNKNGKSIRGTYYRFIYTN